MRLLYSHRLRHRVGSTDYTSPMSFAIQVLLSDAAYSAWANRRLLSASSLLTAEEIERDLQSSQSNILSTLRHICDGEKVWLHCLSTTVEGGTWQLPPGPAPQLSLDALKRQWPAHWKGYSRLLESWSDDVSPRSHRPTPRRTQPARRPLENPSARARTFHVASRKIIGMIRTLGHQPPAIHRMDYYLANVPGTPSPLAP